MNKSKLFSRVAIGLMALMLAIPFALAQTGGQGDGPGRRGGRQRGGRHEMGGRFGGGMFRGLNLTDAQKEQMKQLRTAQAERTRGLREELRAKQAELRQAEQGGSFNEALATQKLTEMASLRAKLMGEQFKARQEMLALLTAEQRTQLEQQREQFKQRREEMKSRRAERNPNKQQQ